MPTIDMHGHFLPEAWLEEVGRHPDRYGVEVLSDDDGYQLRAPYRTSSFRVFQRLFDVEDRLATLDSMRLDAQLLAPPTPALLYRLERPAAQAVARLLNETITDIAAAAPARFIPAATVPMGWPDLAVEELDYAVRELGMRLLFVSTTVAGDSLDEDRFDPIWRRAAEHGIPVQIHPASTEVSARLQRNLLQLLVGNPIDTTVAAACLITGGVLDRYPGLDFVLAHGGGAFPYLSGRMEHGYIHVEAARGSAHPPRDYLDRFYYDTVLHDPAALAFLAQTVGPERLVLGTDCPYVLGDADPIASIERAGLGDQRAILGSNAAALLGGRGSGG